MAKHGLFCTCTKCTRTSLFGIGQTPKPKGKSKGSKSVQLGGTDSYPRRDTGGKPAKRQTQRTHDTKKRGGGQR